MTEIQVKASRPYTVTIGRDLLPGLGGETARLVKGRTAALVSDTNVAPLYLAPARESLEKAGFTVHPFVFPAGESAKNGRTYLELLDFLAENRVTRADVLVALGGGVVSDLTGFAAATFLRGVAFLAVPTTLLAAVDASVGGKTAIDLPHGKNLAGAFYQPRAVWCDWGTLSTLPDDVWSDGCAEVIKYGLIGDPDLLADLESRDFRQDPESVLARCVAMKRDLVEQDEFDTGARQLLNLGHTGGHGIESLSGYTVSHGKAVAMGLCIITRAAEKLGLCPPEVLPRLRALLQKYSLPTETAYAPGDIYTASLSDKKRSGDRLTLAVPQSWGRSVLRTIPMGEWKLWLEKGSCS